MYFLAIKFGVTDHVDTFLNTDQKAKELKGAHEYIMTIYDLSANINNPLKSFVESPEKDNIKKMANIFRYLKKQESVYGHAIYVKTKENGSIEETKDEQQLFKDYKSKVIDVHGKYFIVALGRKIK